MRVMVGNILVEGLEDNTKTDSSGEQLKIEVTTQNVGLKAYLLAPVFSKSELCGDGVGSHSKCMGKTENKGIQVRYKPGPVNMVQWTTHLQKMEIQWWYWLWTL